MEIIIENIVQRMFLFVKSKVNGNEFPLILVVGRGGLLSTTGPGRE